MADFIIARKMAIFDSKIGQFSKYRDPKSKFAKNGHFLFLNEFGQFLKNVFYSWMDFSKNGHFWLENEPDQFS